MCSWCGHLALQVFVNLPSTSVNGKFVGCWRHEVHYVRLSQPSGALSCFCSPWLPAQSQLHTLDSVGAVRSCSPCLCSYFCQTGRGSVQLGFVSVSGTYASENSGESQARVKPNLIIFCSCSKVPSYTSPYTCTKHALPSFGVPLLWSLSCTHCLFSPSTGLPGLWEEMYFENLSV